MSRAVASDADDWGVWVNECGIFASRIGLDRWLDFQARAKPERLIALWMGPGGGEWHLMCGSRADATEARQLFTEVGFHATHVKVARLSACRKKVAGSRAHLDARIAEAAAAVASA